MHHFRILAFREDSRIPLIEFNRKIHTSKQSFSKQTLLLIGVLLKVYLIK